MNEKQFLTLLRVCVALAWPVSCNLAPFMWTKGKTCLPMASPLNWSIYLTLYSKQAGHPLPACVIHKASSRSLRDVTTAPRCKCGSHERITMDAVNMCVITLYRFTVELSQ